MVLLIPTSRDCASPLSALEKWMEVLGSPPSPSWVTVRGMPLQAWHDGTFKPRGNCLGRTLEVDEKTQKMEHLKVGRIKILLDNSVSLPLQVPAWVDDLMFMVLVELSEYSISLEKWKPEVVKPLRTVWMRCFRVPLQVWGTKTFEDICSKLGEVVGIAKETAEKTFLFLRGGSWSC